MKFISAHRWLTIPLGLLTSAGVLLVLLGGLFVPRPFVWLWIAGYVVIMLAFAFGQWRRHLRGQPLEKW